LTTYGRFGTAELAEFFLRVLLKRKYGVAVRLTKGGRLGCVATRTQSVLVAQLLAEGDLTTYGRFGAAELAEKNSQSFFCECSKVDFFTFFGIKTNDSYYYINDEEFGKLLFLPS
jgi:hypothetical protein